jgi:predicted metal-binding protein
MTVTLHVCITCRAGQPQLGDEPVAGARLYRALCDLPAPEGVRIRPVECLSACAQGAAIALTAPGRWSYVQGRMDACDAGQILAGAAAYAAAPDGIVPWRARPAIFRQRSLARIPPIG